MISHIAVLLGVLTSLCSAAEVNVINNCDEQIDPGFYPFVRLPDDFQEQTGGFVLQSHENATVILTPTWHGRIWPRTGCNDEGNCDTGTCVGGINCTAPAPAGPTLAQFTVAGLGGKVNYFNPSTTDGFNRAVFIVPGEECGVGTVGCTGLNEGPGCTETFECPYNVDYDVVFCSLD